MTESFGLRHLEVCFHYRILLHYHSNTSYATRGLYRVEFDSYPISYFSCLKSVKNTWWVIFSRGDLNLEGGGTHPKIFTILPRTYEELPCKRAENHIG